MNEQVQEKVILEERQPDTQKATKRWEEAKTEWVAIYNKESHD